MPVRRGVLRIYLGSAPGVGKTYAMLNEGHRRAARGTDVVVAFVETHGRPLTEAQLDGLEVVPRRRVVHRGVTLEEMDVDAVLARRPQLCLVDELAHTNAPGSAHAKRWQDVDVLLDAGIDVVSTVNVQHLESLNDVVAQVTGVKQGETVPDAVVRRADQIELVDMSPEALRRRLAHGNVYPAERVDAALSNYFRPGNLAALRELALLWVADRVEDSLGDYLAAHGIAEPWETRERVVVALTGGPSGGDLVRRAARIAGRGRGELIGVHVHTADGLRTSDNAALEQQRDVLTGLGGSYHEVAGDEVAEALVAFARTQRATQLVIGASVESRWRRVLGATLVSDVLADAGALDVHVIAHESAGGSSLAAARPRRTPLAARRRGAAWLVLLACYPLATALLVPHRDDLTLSTPLFVYLLLAIVVAALGGIGASVAAAIVGSTLGNVFFTRPFGSLLIDDPEDVVAIVVFAAVALTVATAVDRAAWRSRHARRARDEAEALARTTATLAADPDPLPALVAQVHTTFGLDGAAVLARSGSGWTSLASAGHALLREPADGTAFAIGPAAAADGRTLVVTGRELTAEDVHVLTAIADQLAVGLHARAAAEQAHRLTDVDHVRTALLQAVSHELRTPLASIKAYVSGLRATDVQWSDDDLADALAAVDAETDRLNRLIGNLLDASRLQAGALAVALQGVSVAEVVAGALAGVDDAGRVRVEVPEDLPPVRADAALLERSLGNLLVNALKHAPDGPVDVKAGAVGGHVDVLVVDRGPGIAATRRAEAVRPFQRLGDGGRADGVGLGLAIAQGFVGAMGGALRLDDTPGGGLTVTVELPIDRGVAP